MTPPLIRAATDADRPAIVDVYNHYVLNTAITFDLATFTAKTRSPWFETFADTGGASPGAAAGRHRLLVAEEAGAVAGYACSAPLRPKAAYDRSVETTIYLHADARRRGLGRVLYGALLEALEATDVHRCYAVVTLPNDASVALHEALGFETVGRLTECGHKFDRWWDVLWMERSLGA